jgi:hypothetical protein
MKIYKSYMFKDKDPAIDELRTVVQRANGGANRITNKALTAIEHDGGPTSSCMRAWFFGVTKRPQNATLEAAGRALGYQRVWVRQKRKPNGQG